MLEVDGAVRVSSVTRGEDGRLDVRLNEIEGRSAAVNVYSLSGEAMITVKPYSIADAVI